MQNITDLDLCYRGALFSKERQGGRDVAQKVMEDCVADIFKQASVAQITSSDLSFFCGWLEKLAEDYGKLYTFKCSCEKELLIRYINKERYRLIENKGEANLAMQADYSYNVRDFATQESAEVAAKESLRRGSASPQHYTARSYYVFKIDSTGVGLVSTIMPTDEDKARLAKALKAAEDCKNIDEIERKNEELEARIKNLEAALADSVTKLNAIRNYAQ